jgi:hypothetical protein
MLLRIALTGFGLSALFLAACSGGGSSGPTAPSAPTASPTASPTPAPCPTNTNVGSGVLICQSSATNVKGYSVLLQTSGAATIVEGDQTTTGTASSSTTSQLFSDLNANAPVTNIQTYGPCTKSASFGTSTTVTYLTNGTEYTSGDISCPAPSSSPPAPVTTIYTDVQNVESSLGLTGQ